VEGLRQSNGIAAGATGMPWPRFVLFNAAGAALWVGVWSTLGYTAGDHWRAITAVVHRYDPYVVVLLAAAGLALLLWRLRRHHHDPGGTHHDLLTDHRPR
jgi:membrane protein DedA with SNARE-associated domain